MRKALEADREIEYTHPPGETFPTTMEELSQYDVVILSDIGANSLLLSRRVFVEGKTSSNRLLLIKAEVHSVCVEGTSLSPASKLLPSTLEHQ